MLAYDFTDSSKWDLFWEFGIEAEYIGDPTFGRHNPIPEQVAPLQIEQPVIAYLCLSETARSTWNYAGNLQIRIPTGINEATGGIGYTVVHNRRIYLNQETVLEFPRFASSFIVAVRFPYWFDSVDFQLWEYTGDIIDTTEQKLDDLQADITEIKAAVVP